MEDFERICERVGNVRDEAVAQGARIVHRTKQVMLIIRITADKAGKKLCKRNLLNDVREEQRSCKSQSLRRRLPPRSEPQPCILKWFYIVISNHILFLVLLLLDIANYVLTSRCLARFLSQWSTGITWALPSCLPGWRTTSSSSSTTGLSWTVSPSVSRAFSGFTVRQVMNSSKLHNCDL